MRLVFLFSFLLLTACDSHAPQVNPPNSSFSGRNSDRIYRIFIPAGWNASFDPYQQDTMLPLLTLSKEETKIVIHNFPGMEISPRAQVQRWQKQLHEEEGEISPVSWGGFTGLRLESSHMIAFGLSPCADIKRDQSLPEECASPVTIKATGEIALLKEEIDAIAHSFELKDSYHADD